MKESEDSTPQTDSSPPVLSSKERSKPARASKIYVIGYVIACLFFDLLALPAWEMWIDGSRVRFISDGSAAAILGCVAGQMGFVAVLAGLGSIRWIRGFALACILTLVAYATWLGSLLLSSWADLTYMGNDAEPILWLTCLVPVLLLCLGIPFALLRLATGWHVTTHAMDRAKVPFSINDFFITTIVVASMAYLVSSPQVLVEFGDSYWIAVGIGSLVLAGFSLFCFLPVFLVSQKINSGGIRTIAYLVAALVTALTLIMIFHFAGAPTSPDNVGMAFIGVFVAGLNYCVGLEAMRASGFRLAGIAKGNDVRSTHSATPAANQPDPTDAPEASPWDESEDEKEQPAQDSFWDSLQAAYLCAAFVFSIAVAVGVIKFGIDVRLRWRLEELNELGASYFEQGGELVLSGDMIICAKLGPRGTNKQLQELAERISHESTYPYLYELDLSGTQVDDRCVEALKEFYSLQWLDLSNSGITDQGVRELIDANYMNHLNISGIPLSFATLQTILDLAQVDFLDLSDTGITIQDLSSTQRKIWPKGIGLRNMGLTDKELVAFLQGKSFFYLDLRGNKLTGSFLHQLPQEYRRLKLGGNPLQDEEIALAAKSGVEVNYLELGEDSLSEQCIPDLLTLAKYGLSLENGSFSEADIIANAGEFRVLRNSLSLRGIQYTGRALAALESSAKVESLDMSHSGVNTETLQVIETSHTETLDLSHTQIDDRAIPVLSKMKLTSLNLSYTSLTAEGIRQGDWSRIGHLIVAPGQFAFAELEQIRQVVSIDNSNHKSYDDQ